VSPDQRLIAVRLEEGPGPNDRKAFAIVELKTRRVVVEVEVKSEHVYGFAWAPDSARLAVLKTTDHVNLGGVLDWLLTILHGPISYYQLVLEIYTVAGQQLASSRLFPAPVKLHGASIVWYGECGPPG
jgi:hypothetical protein